MTAPLWTHAELCTITGGRLDGPDPGLSSRPGDGGAEATIRDPGFGQCTPEGQVTAFSIDTRSLQPGDAFVALKDVRDGHDFVPAAFTAGAGLAIVRADYHRQPGDGVLLRVDDPLGALERIAAAARARLAPDARVVAVTGSAGKTTTKEMLRTAFEAVAPGRVHASIKSYNNHWGVPLMLAGMPAETQFAVFEIGMNHAGEITPLTKLVRPHVAVVVNVLPVHVGNFPDGEIGVADAKAEIFDGLAPGGTAVIPADSPHTTRLRDAATRARATVRSFALGRDVAPDLSIRQTAATSPGESPTYLVQQKFGDDIRLTLGVPGEHNAADALAVLLALEACGVDVVRASKALAHFGAPPGRGDRTILRLDGGQALLIDESYNANPASMRAAIATAAATFRDDGAWTRLVLVLGEMLELGPDAERHHRDLTQTVTAAAQSGDTIVFACGPTMKHLYDALPPPLRGTWAPTAADLEPAVLAAIRPGDVVMVKGSNGARTWAIVAAIKKRFATARDGR